MFFQTPASFSTRRKTLPHAAPVSLWNTFKPVKYIVAKLDPPPPPTPTPFCGNSFKTLNLENHIQTWIIFCPKTDIKGRTSLFNVKKRESPHSLCCKDVGKRIIVGFVFSWEELPSCGNNLFTVKENFQFGQCFWLLLLLSSVQSRAAVQRAVHPPQDPRRRPSRLLEVQRAAKLQEEPAEEQGGSVGAAGPDQVPGLWKGCAEGRLEPVVQQ